MPNRPLLYATSFIAGLTTLGIELTTARLLGNIYGTSDVAYAGIISMMLAYLTIGYFVGGRIADRHPDARVFYALLAWASLCTALIPFIGRPALLGAAVAFAEINIGAIVLWVVVTLVLFIVPVGLLGMVSPYVIRLAVDDPAHSGKVAGRVYALNTAGSLLGAFGAVLVLVPGVGTTPAFLILASIPLIVALAGMLIEGGPVVRHAWMPFVIGLLAIFGLRGPIKPPPPGLSLLYEAETPYNLVQVVETENRTRYMLLNEGVAIHSIYNPEIPVAFTGGVWDYFLVAPYLNEPPFTPDEVERLAIIGLAGGTVAKQYTGVYGEGIAITGVEIDPELVQVGRDYFGMTMPNLDVLVEDGRVALDHMGAGYTVVAIDAYRVPYVPWHMTTVEFFREVDSVLAEDGSIVLNVGRTPINRELINAIVRTLQEVFPSVYVVDVPNTFNSLVYATRQPTSADNLQANLNALSEDGDPLLRASLRLAYENLQPVEPGDIVLTDDHAPVEGIVHRLVLEYIVAGGTEDIGRLGD
ncbi:MAG: spermidine synthase [Anaerolineae bacterium]